MFNFIKNLFKRNNNTTEESSTCPFLVHTDISESIVIKEVALVDVKPKARKSKATNLTEVKPVTALAKPKAKTVKAEPAKIVQLVQPTPAKKKGRPKKDKTV